MGAPANAMPANDGFRSRPKLHYGGVTMPHVYQRLTVIVSGTTMPRYFAIALLVEASRLNRRTDQSRARTHNQ